MRINARRSAATVPVFWFLAAALAGPVAVAAPDAPVAKSASAHAANPPRKRHRGKSGAPIAAQRSPHGGAPRDPHAINDDVALTPFPSHAAETRKALEQNRREQLADAERAARDGHEPERWDTVLFHLRELDSRADTEACFWRVIAYYRKGELDRARALRGSCELPPKDDGIAEVEDARASQVVSPTALQDRPQAPVVDASPYDGAGPTRVER